MDEFMRGVLFGAVAATLVRLSLDVWRKYR